MADTTASGPGLQQPAAAAAAAAATAGQASPEVAVIAARAPTANALCLGQPQ